MSGPYAIQHRGRLLVLERELGIPLDEERTR